MHECVHETSERERERETDREKDKQTDGWTDRQTNRRTDRQPYREMGNHTDMRETIPEKMRQDQNRHLHTYKPRRWLMLLDTHITS